MIPARLLDLTRSLRRAGRMPTGVDRVERAYLTHFLTLDEPLFAMLRTAFGYVLLDKSGAKGFLNQLEARDPWPERDILSRLPRGRDVMTARAESSVRRAALARCVPGGLVKMLRRHLPQGFEYYNTGHSNLTERVLTAMGAAGGSVHVLIHDVIPLEHPSFQRPGTVEPFRAKLQRVSAHADRVIYNSGDTRARAEAQMANWVRIPPAIVAHLGTVTPVPDTGALPPDLPPKRPYFVTVGTIEPRKNHGFLLDLWKALGPDAPPLLICGTRGWNNDAVFARLDTLPPDGPVQEVTGLSDGALAALVKQSAGTLFPSLAEGFGYPPLEALSLEARVLCNDLDVLREILGDAPDFVPVSDTQSWLRLVKSWESTPSHAGKVDRFVGSNWPDHFKTVLRLR